MGAKTFRDLIVWQKAHDLVLKIYKATRNFPDEEKFGLVSQMRRSALSIPSNIVEGFRRKGRDKLNFYYYSLGVARGITISNIFKLRSELHNRRKL